MIRRGDQTVADALARVPGLNVQHNGPLGTLSDLTLDGYRTNQILLLIDGRPAGGEQIEFPAIDTMPTAGVERIEVVEGGGATLYGTGALGGVINVITTGGAGLRARPRVAFERRLARRPQHRVRERHVRVRTPRQPQPLRVPGDRTGGSPAVGQRRRRRHDGARFSTAGALGALRIERRAPVCATTISARPATPRFRPSRAPRARTRRPATRACGSASSASAPRRRSSSAARRSPRPSRSTRTIRRSPRSTCSAARRRSRAKARVQASLRNVVQSEGSTLVAGIDLARGVGARRRRHRAGDARLRADRGVRARVAHPRRRRAVRPRPARRTRRRLRRDRRTLARRARPARRRLPAASELRDGVPRARHHRPGVPDVLEPEPAARALAWRRPLARRAGARRGVAALVRAKRERLDRNEPELRLQPADLGNEPVPDQRRALLDRGLRRHDPQPAVPRRYLVAFADRHVPRARPDRGRRTPRAPPGDRERPHARIRTRTRPACSTPPGCRRARRRSARYAGDRVHAGRRVRALPRRAERAALAAGVQPRQRPLRRRRRASRCRDARSRSSSRRADRMRDAWRRSPRSYRSRC